MSVPASAHDFHFVKLFLGGPHTNFKFPNLFPRRGFPVLSARFQLLYLHIPSPLRTFFLSKLQTKNGPWFMIRSYDIYMHSSTQHHQGRILILIVAHTPNTTHGTHIHTRHPPPSKSKFTGKILDKCMHTNTWYRINKYPT